MNIIDALLILIILIGVYSGFHKGFIAGAIDLILLAVSLVFAFWASRYLALFFDKNITSLGVWSLPLAFILSYIFIRLILSALASALRRSMPERTENNFVNKTLGIFPGFINGLIYAAIISALLLAAPLFDGLSAKTRESILANRFSPQVEWAEDKLAPVFDKAVNHTFNKLTVEPESNKSLVLPFSVKDPKIREDLEAEMLVMVNQERAKEGLHALKADPEIREVARAHSKDMFARSYFSHTNPDGKSPGDRIKAAGVKFLTAGENLAWAQTLRIAHKGLMNSPGHRANILHRSFGRVGIGILEGGRHGIMVTQNFRN